MRRCISIFMVFLALSSFIGTPASAAELEGFQWMQLLEYGGPNGYNNNISFRYEAGDVAKFDYPYYVSSSTVDAVVQIRYGTPTAITATLSGGQVHTLNFTLIDTDTYRITGDLGRVRSNSISFEVSFTGSYLYLMFYSCKISTGVYAYKKTTGQVSITAYDALPSYSSGWLNQTEYGVAVGSQFNTNYTTTYYSEEYRASFYANGTSKYDFLEFDITLTVESVLSLYAEQNGVMLPIEYSYFNASSGTPYYDTYSNFEVEGRAYGENRTVNIMVRVDLSSCDFSSGDFVYLKINGTFSSTEKASIYLNSVRGYVETYTEEPTLFYLRSLYNSFGSYLKNIQNNTASLLSGFNSFLTEFGSYVEDFTAYSTFVETLLPELQNLLISDLQQNAQNYLVLQEISSRIFTFYNSFDSFVTTQLSNYESMLQLLQEDRDFMDEWIPLIYTDFSGYLVSIVDSVGFLETISDKLSSIWTMIAAVQDSIVEFQNDVHDQFVTANQWLEDIFNKGQDEADSFQQEVDKDISDLESEQDILDTLQKPDFDKDLGVISTAQVVRGNVFISNIISNAMKSDYLSFIFTWSFMLAVVSYVIYGKR